MLGFFEGLIFYLRKFETQDFSVTEALTHKMRRFLHMMIFKEPTSMYLRVMMNVTHKI